MYTLGINAAFHDSAACLVKDGVVLAAAEEERFTGIKHAKRPVPFSAYELPYHAIDYCLKDAGIMLREVRNVAYSFNPYLLPGARRDDAVITLPLEPSGQPPSGGTSPWDPLFFSFIVNAPRQLAGGAPHHLQERFRGVRHDGPHRWFFVDHHLAHAASAFHASPFAEAAVLVIDGRGERATTTYYRGGGTELSRLGEVTMPHSLGLLYEMMTEYLGFLRSSDEYKVMALASYGKPAYLGRFKELIAVKNDGTYEIRPFDPEDVFGPARVRGSAVEQRHYDIARSLQEALEDSVLKIARSLKTASGADKLCIAGGVGLNCVLNARLRDWGPFTDIWVQPAAGDAGTALGAALLIDGQARGEKTRPYVMEHVYLGPSYKDDEIENALKRAKCAYRRLDDVAGTTAGLLEQDKIIGWFQGRMEFGPRALGARSILASPLHAEMQQKLNEIKDREDFRPVAPAVLEEDAADWFAGARVSPFMLFVHDVLPGKASSIPAVTHVDGTARVQTVRRNQNPRYYDLIAAFKRRTGVPVLVNTSFNTRGKPIVCSPQDALECFWTSPLDALVIGSFLVEKP